MPISTLNMPRSLSKKNTFWPFLFVPGPSGIPDLYQAQQKGLRPVLLPARA
jgi:hypothetical protein